MTTILNPGGLLTGILQLVADELAIVILPIAAFVARPMAVRLRRKPRPRAWETIFFGAAIWVVDTLVLELLFSTVPVKGLGTYIFTLVVAIASGFVRCAIHLPRAGPVSPAPTAGPGSGEPVSEEQAEVRSLYLHIPFCERRCEYCDFVSMAGREREVEYMAALVAEVRELAHRVGRSELDTVFVGGGTPSFVDPGRLGGPARRGAGWIRPHPGLRGHARGQPIEHWRGPRPALARSRLHPGEPRHPEPRAGHPRLPRPGSRRRSGAWRRLLRSAGPASPG